MTMPTRAAALRLTALSALGLASAPRSLAAQDLTTLRIAGTPIDDFKTVPYAVKAGIFRKYGLAAEITMVNSGAAGLAAVAGGSVHVCSSSLPALVQAHVRGVPFRIVAPAQLYLTDAPAVLLLVKKDSPIQSARDLNGKTIASASLGDLNSVSTTALVDQNGGDAKSLKFVELPLSTVVTALDDGRVDAYPVAAPYFDQALATGRVRVLAKPYDAIAKRFEATAYVAIDSYVAANGATLERFARAMHESIVYTNAHLPETADLVASYSGVDAAIVGKSVRAVDAEYVEARNIQPFIDFAAKYKLIPAGFDAQDLIAPTVLKPPR